MTELHLIENIHPKREATKEYDALVGIDALKESLVNELILILDRARLDAWRATHHPVCLAILDGAKSSAPLILLLGDVGCGKTALASCVATTVAKAIDQRVACIETPSDLRGGGHVGELPLARHRSLHASEDESQSDWPRRTTHRRGGRP